MPVKRLVGGKFRKEFDISAQLDILDKFAADKITEVDALKKLYDLYWLPPPPINSNLKFKKETLDKLKKGEINKETAERNLRTMFKIRGDYIPRNNKNLIKKTPVKKNTPAKVNNKPKANNKKTPVKKVSVKKN